MISVVKPSMKAKSVLLATNLRPFRSSIQYKLSLFGFLAGREIAKDGPLNAELLDQHSAIEWVQRHIGVFGGNPSRVSIWGGSAGRGSVSCHLTAFGGRERRHSVLLLPSIHGGSLSSTILPKSNSCPTLFTLSNCAILNCLRS